VFIGAVPAGLESLATGVAIAKRGKGQPDHLFRNLSTNN
jgi:hypothetical protein